MVSRNERWEVILNRNNATHTMMSSKINQASSELALIPKSSGVNLRERERVYERKIKWRRRETLPLTFAVYP